MSTELDIKLEKNGFHLADLVMQTILIFFSIISYGAVGIILGFWQVSSSFIRTSRLWDNLYFQKLLRRYWVWVLLSFDAIFVNAHRGGRFPDLKSMFPIIVTMITCFYYIYITVRLVQFSYYQINPSKKDIVNDMITKKGIQNWEKYLHYSIIFISIIVIGYVLVFEFWYRHRH